MLPMMSSHYNRSGRVDDRPVQAIVESVKINRPTFWQFSRMWWCVIANKRKVPAAVRRVFARLEQAFANFAQVPFRDGRTLRELEQMSDDLEDWPEETRPRR
jgi:hypothetical protein